MEKLTEFLAPHMAHLGTMKYLIGEIFLALLAASILGLIIGWLCKGAFAREKLMERESEWGQKFRDLEETKQNEINTATAKAKRDQKELMSRIDNTDQQNAELSESLEHNESAVKKAKNEVERLNSKQTETQKRLQKIIAEKDNLITDLRNQNQRSKNTPPNISGVGNFTARDQNQYATNQQNTINNEGQSQSGGPFQTAQHPDVATHGSNRDEQVDNRPQDNYTPSQLGGQPTGFPTGHQVRSDDFDKTQVIDDTLRHPSGQSHNDSSAIPSTSHEPYQQPSGNDQPSPNNFGQNLPGYNTGVQQIEGYENTESQYPNDRFYEDSSLHEPVDNVTDLTNVGDTLVDEYGNVPAEKSVKKSFWNRVKSKVSKTVEKTKL